MKVTTRRTYEAGKINYSSVSFPWGDKNKETVNLTLNVGNDTITCEMTAYSAKCMMERLNEMFPKETVEDV